MHDANGEEPIYRESAGGAGELKRAVRQACAGLMPAGPLLFRGGRWEMFYAETFAGGLAACLVEAYSAAAAGEIDRVIAADEQFMRPLNPAAAARLTGAAGMVFDAREGARAMRALQRLRKRHPSCGYPAAFAAHAAAFNLPLLHVLVAYLYVEWAAAGGAGDAGLEVGGDLVDTFLERLSGSPEPVQQVLGRHLGGWAKVV